MTSLGKVFTGLIFLLSTVFFTFSVAVIATHSDRKENAAALEAEARDSEARNNQLRELQQSYTDELQIESRSRRHALAALQTQYEAAEFNYFQRESEATNLRKALTTASQTNAATQKDLRDAAATNRDLRTQIKTTKETRDQLFTEMVDAKKEFNNLQGVYQSLKDRADSMGL